MAHEITCFPVGNGDMTLIKLDDTDKTTILIDIHIRKFSSDERNSEYDGAAGLRERLATDNDGRPYVDAFLLTHPDEDHCRGLREHFHLGPMTEYQDEPKDGEKKILAHELWSSPMVFRRASKNHTLCDDAKAFNTEAKRRVQVFKDAKSNKPEDLEPGDRVVLIGEDEEGKTDDIQELVRKVGDIFSKVNAKKNGLLEMYVLGPLPKSNDVDEEEARTKNHSSTIIQFLIREKRSTGGARLLSCGDAEVAILERLWKDHKNEPEPLEYDLLIAPHHCSWHALSHDSWSKKGSKREVSKNAKSALSQADSGAFIVASSKPVKDDDSDPPCIGAKREYEKILKDVDGEFICTGEHPNEKKPEPLVFRVTKDGLQRPAKTTSDTSESAAIIGATSEQLGHG